jgi:hypothetical protein
VQQRSTLRQLQRNVIELAWCLAHDSTLCCVPRYLSPSSPTPASVHIRRVLSERCVVLSNQPPANVMSQLESSRSTFQDLPLDLTKRVTHFRDFPHLTTGFSSSAQQFPRKLSFHQQHFLVFCSSENHIQPFHPLSIVLSHLFVATPPLELDPRH